MSFPTSIRRIIVVPFEGNYASSDTVWHNDPYFASLMDTYGNATNFRGYCNLSLPDYFLETSGNDQVGCNDMLSINYWQCSGGQFNVNNIYKALTAVGLKYENWADFSNQSNGRHVPGWFYTDSCAAVMDARMSSNPPSGFFAKYVFGNQVPPDYTWVTANMCDIGHDCPVSTASAWLKSWLPILMNKSWFTDGTTLVTLVGDDGGSSSNSTLLCYISTSSIGKSSNIYYTHANDLSTVMWLLGIPGSIGSSNANAAIKDLFNLAPPSNLAVSLSINPSQITVNQQATFNANVTGGIGPFQFQWS